MNSRRTVSPRARNSDVEDGWVPIAGLSDLARALLGELRDDRDVIPARVAERLTARADRWAAHGFTAQTVGPWTELAPEDAALLAASGATPATLERHIVAAPAGHTSLWQALTSGAMSAAEAAKRLSAPAPATPARPAPALFSHPVADPEPDDTDRRRRSMPPSTPFSA